MKQRIFFLSVFILLLFHCHGQKENKEKSSAFYGGIGAGLDYGGLGFKVEYLPIKNFGIFAGGGYNFSDLGYNGGLSWKITPKKNWTPTLIAMYGYNAVLITKSSFGGSFRDTYYGFTPGAGLDFYVGKKSNKVSMAVFVPFRSKEFKDRYDLLKSLGYSFNPDILPFTLSMGINVGGK